ncbi:gprin3 [Pungitius sinensis]
MCPNQNAGVVFHSETLCQQQDKRLGAKPKDPGSALCNTQPVYQINIEHSLRKEPGDTANSPSNTAAQNPAAEAPPLGPGALREAAGAPKPGSADSHNAAPPPAATKPSHALTTTTTTTAAAAATSSRPGPAKNKSESPKQKAKGAGKAQKKAAKSGKQKTEPEGKKKEDQKEMDIHDVVWDEQGMTWEVYGASVDPESLGFAIQSHLQCKIKEQERKLVVQTSFRKSASGADSPGPGGTKNKRRRQNIFRSMLQNVRRPNCCLRPPPSSVLE